MDESLLFAILAFITFSFAGITAKISSQKLGGFNTTLMYAFSYLLILVPTFLIFVRNIEIQNIKYGLIAGTISCLAILFTNKALETGKASVTIPLISSYPLLMILWAKIFLKETLVWYQYLGAIFTVIGIILLTAV